MRRSFAATSLVLLALSTSITADPRVRSVPKEQPGPPAGKVSAGIYVHHPPEFGTSAWFADTALVGAHITSLAESALVACRFGSAYPGTRGGRCEEFHGHSYSVGPEEYWVFRCGGPDLIGRRDDFYYQLSPDSHPTLERVIWTLRIPVSSPQDSWERLLRTLGTQVGQGAPATLDSLWSGLELTLSRAGQRTHIRLMRSGDEAYGRLELERISNDLSESWTRSSSDPGSHEPDRVQERVVSALVHDLPQEWTELRRAIQAGTSRQEDQKNVFGAVRNASGRSPSERDAILYAAHLWARRRAGSLSPADTASALELNDSLGPYGAAVLRTYEGDWCYDWGLSKPLVERPAASRWAEEAFLEWMDIGWEAPCGLCGWTQSFGPDQWKEVLRRGEEFLARYPESRIAPNVTYMLAAAHETAWSLSKAAGDESEEYIDPHRYRLDAPRHRQEAIRLYEVFLAMRPHDPGKAGIEQRLGRMRLDVDTDFHRFWCVWD